MNAIIINISLVTKLLNLKLVTGSGLQIMTIFLAKITLIEIFVIDSVLKTNTWIDKIKDLNGEEIKESSYKKELSFNKL